MTRNCERPESAQVSSVFQREEAEGDDDEEDRFLMDMPAEEERCVAAERDRCHKIVPRWLEEQLDESGLFIISLNQDLCMPYIRFERQASR